METPTGAARRRLKARETLWAGGLTRALARLGVSPNAVSIVGMLFALLAGYSFVRAPYGGRPELWWALGALAVQLRMLCNMLDGMLAIEAGRHTKLGELYNDLPDRISDSLILVGAGFSVEQFLPGGSALGWLAALLAVLTSYVRVLGGAMGVPQPFAGPLAKLQRMFVITAGAIVAGIQNAVFRPGWAMIPALLIVVVGSAATIVRRVEYIAKTLNSR